MWAAPLLAHAVALSAVLIALAAFVGTRYSYTSDEGAAIVQARHLSEHGTWIVPHPVPQIDRDNHFYPYVPAEVGDKGVAPLGKHPAYVVVLAALWSLGGISALVGLSIFGTVVAALAAAAIAQDFDVGLARPTLWALGLASPLYFDSFLVVAHTVAAAAGGALVLVISRRSPRFNRAVVVAAVAVLAAALVLLRTEALFFVAAVALAAVVSPRTRWLGVVTGVSGALAFLGERAWTHRIIGTAITPTWRTAEGSGGGGGLFRQRLDGAVHTLLLPSDSSNGLANRLLLLAFLGFGVAVLLAARHSPRAGLVAAASATLVAARVLMAPLDTVPGLLMACPLLWVGGWAALVARRRDAAERFHWLLLALFAVAVLATQYQNGGGLEWGGRYFALALPVAIPLAIVGLRSLPRAVLASVAAASVALTLLGVLEIRDTHRSTGALLARIHVPRDAIGITTASLLPRLDWAHYPDRQWLLVPPDEVDAVLKQLPAAGVHRAVVVFPDDRAPTGWHGRGEQIPGFGWRTATVSVG